jgi:preprotein translocase subunit SecG
LSADRWINKLLYVLYAIFFISCIVLVGAVLLQPGKTDAGALFTSNVSSASFGPRGTASVLSKFTIAAAGVFMVSALLISMPAFSGNVSVLSSAAEEAPAEQPAEVPAATNSNADANSAPDANAAANQGLIETPATNSFEQKADNSAAAPANAAPANNQ